MPNPTISDVHVDRPLTSISVAYMQSAEKFVAPSVFPRISVSKQSDQYFTYPKGYWFRSEVRRRAPGTPTPGTGSTRSTGSYYCPVYGLHEDVDDQTRANTDSPLDADADAVSLITTQMLLKQDLLWFSSFFKTGVWTGKGPGGSSADQDMSASWATASTNVVDDVRKASTAMLKETGFRPNVAITTPPVEDALMANTDLRDRIKYTQQGFISRDLMASAFGLDRFLVTEAIQNTGPEGGTDSFGWAAAAGTANADGFLLLYVPPSPGIRTPSAGYTFTWTGYHGAEALGTRIKKFRLEEIASDRVEIECAFDYKLVSADLGTFIANVI